MIEGKHELVEKAKTASPATLNKIMDEVLPYVSTSLDVNEMLEVLGQITQYNIVGKDGFPFAEYRTTATLGKKGSCVIPVDLESNVVWLHQFLFDDANYTVTDSVKEYSRKINADTSPYLNK